MVSLCMLLYNNNKTDEQREIAKENVNAMIEYWNDELEFFNDRLFYDFNMKFSETNRLNKNKEDYEKRINKNRIIEEEKNISKEEKKTKRKVIKKKKEEKVIKKEIKAKVVTHNIEWKKYKEMKKKERNKEKSSQTNKKERRE